MKTVISMAGFLVLSMAALAQDPADRAKLIGSWELETPSTAENARGWTLNGTEDNLRVTHTQAGRPVLEFECNTMGKECVLKERKTKVSMWYAGSALMELETRGSDVLKRRFSVDGDVLTVEETSVVPSGKSETQKFKRVQVSADAKTH